MRIYADDGKEFATVDECNAYESNLALKKQKEGEDRKAKEERRGRLRNRIMDNLESLGDSISTYEKETGEKVSFGFENGEPVCEYSKKHLHTDNTIKILDGWTPYYNTIANQWDKLLELGERRSKMID